MIIVFLIQLVFLLILVSYYVLLFVKLPINNKSKLKSLTVLMPARNESKHIDAAIKSVLNADYPIKEIIVVDDASTDNTAIVVKKYPVTLLSLKKHGGKARALNLGLSKAKGDYIAIVDADSVIKKDSLINACSILGNKKIAGVTSVIKVKNNNRIGMWLHIEQLYNSLLRVLLSKINANIITPGPLSVYKKIDLIKANGFEVHGYSEDVDIAIKLIRNGKRIIVSENCVAETNMPMSLKGFLAQRTRFIKGWIHVFKRHLRLGLNITDVYSLPLALFSYVQAIIMSVFIISQLYFGYMNYFFLKGVLFDFNVFVFFFQWFSIFGIINWIYNIILGNVVLTFFTFISLLTSLLSYPLYFISILKYDKKITVYHIIPLIFMFPYWFVIMILQVLNIGEWFIKYKENKWEKIN